MLDLNYIPKEDIPFIQSESQKPFLAKKQLKIQSYQNALICPGLQGGVYSENYWVPESILQWNTQPIFLKEQPPHAQAIIQEEVVFIGNFLSVWGHEITDNLSHIWFYFNENYSYLKNLTFVYTLLWENNDCSHYFFDLFNLLGITQSQIKKIDRPTQFQKVYVPDECFFFDFQLNIRRFTPEYLNILAHLPRMAPIEKAPKIYFSRLAHGKTSKNFNESEIENFFKNQGFKIVYPEKLTFSEELAYLQQAEIFAATEGSIAHNSLFCPPNTTILLLKKCRYVATHQITINQMKNARVVYIDVSYSPLANRNAQAWTQGPFFLYVSPFLCRYFNLAPHPFPWRKFVASLMLSFREWGWRGTWIHLDHLYLGFTHPLRAKLQLKTRFCNIIRFATVNLKKFLKK